MSECTWEEIHGFSSLGEHTRFVSWIERQKEMNVCEELLQPESPLGAFPSRLFKCRADGAIWKLTVPDPGYFPGSWLPSDDR